MNKSTVIVLAIICISISCNFPKKMKEKSNGETIIELKKSTLVMDSNYCYADTLKWLIADSSFFDTIIFFRNFNETDSSMRVSCILNDFNPAVESLIFNNEDIRFICKSYKKLKWYLFISYEMTNKEIILSVYHANIITSETYEFRRYQIINNKITGINLFPTITDGFMPYDEFIKQKPHEM